MVTINICSLKDVYCNYIKKVPMHKIIFILFFFPFLAVSQKIKSKKYITLVPKEAKYAFDSFKKVNWEVNFDNNTSLSNPKVDSTYIESFYKNSEFTISETPDIKFIIDVHINRSKVSLTKDEYGKYCLFGSSRTVANARIVRKGTIVFSQDIVLEDADITDRFQINDISSRYHLHTKENDDLTNANLYVKSDSNKFSKLLRIKNNRTKVLTIETETKILKRQTYKLIKSAYHLFGEYYLGNKNFDYLKWFYIKDKSDTYTQLSKSIDVYKKSKEDNIYTRFNETTYLKNIEKIKTDYENFLTNNPSISDEIKGFVNLNLMNCHIALGEFKKAKSYYQKGKVTKDKYLEKKPKIVFENAVYTSQQIEEFKAELNKFNDLNTVSVSNVALNKYYIINLMYIIEYRMAMFKKSDDYPCAEILKKQLGAEIDSFLRIDVSNLEFFKFETRAVITEFQNEIIKRYQGKSFDHTLFNKIGYLLTGDYTDQALKKQYGSTYKFYKKILRMNHLYTLVTKSPKECAVFYGEDYNKDLASYKEMAQKTDIEFNSAAIDIVNVFENVDFSNLNFNQLSDNYMAKTFGKGIVIDFDKIYPDIQKRIPIVTSSFALSDIMLLLSNHKYYNLSDNDYNLM